MWSPLVNGAREMMEMTEIPLEWIKEKTRNKHVEKNKQTNGMITEKTAKEAF